MKSNLQVYSENKTCAEILSDAVLQVTSEHDLSTNQRSESFVFLRSLGSTAVAYCPSLVSGCEETPPNSLSSQDKQDNSDANALWDAFEAKRSAWEMSEATPGSVYDVDAELGTGQHVSKISTPIPDVDVDHDHIRETYVPRNTSMLKMLSLFRNLGNMILRQPTAVCNGTQRSHRRQSRTKEEKS